MNFPMVLTTPTLHSKLPRIHSSVICKERRERGKGEGRRAVDYIPLVVSQARPTSAKKKGKIW